MALSPADFYAYSRATGVQIPEDPQERAEMAPEVLEFRRNQLKVPQQDSNILQTVGATALAGAAALGAGLAARRFMRGRTELPKAPVRAANQGVVQQDLSALRRAAAASVPASEPVSPSRPAPGTTENALEIDPTDRLLKELGEMRAQKSRELQFRMESAYKGNLQKTADELLAQLKTEGPNLTDIQQATQQLQQQQFISAVESGEDQVSGRIKQRLQQNEDLDLSQIEVLEEIAEYNRIQGMEQDEPIVRAAAQLPDGVPLVQTEEPTFTPEMARQNIEIRRQALREQGLSPGRIERELLSGATGTNLKQAAELFAVTGDPEVLRLASAKPALPLEVKPQGQQLIAQTEAETIPTKTFYEPFAKREANIDKQLETDIRQTNLISSLSSELKAVPQFIDNPAYQQLNENTLIAKQLIDTGNEMPGLRQEFNRNMALLQSGKIPQQIPNPEYAQLQEKLTSSQNIRAAAREELGKREALASEFPNIYRVKQMQEGVRLYGQADLLTGEVVPGTLETRLGRPSVPGGVVSKPAAGSFIRGMRGAVEMESFIPEERQQAGTAAQEAAMGPRVGIQPERREAMLDRPVAWDPNIHSPKQRTPEGFVYSEEALRKPSQFVGKERSMGPVKSSPEVARRSVELSEQLRRVQLEQGYEAAQDFLAKVRKGLL